MIRTLHFNGKDNYIDLGDISAAQNLVTGPFTIECWVKETLAQEWTCFVGAVTDKSRIEQGWMLGVTFDRRFTFGLVTENTDGIVYLKAPESYEPGAWHHLAGVYDGSEMRLYVDGALVNTAAGITGAVVYPETGTFSIGAFKDIYDFYPYAGRLADMRLWNKVRTESEIHDNRFLRLDISVNTELAGYWPLDDAAGTTARDYAETTPGTILGDTVTWGSQPDLTLGGFSPAPLPPEILASSNITDDSFVAAWNAVPDVTDYYIDVATDNAFTTILPAYDNFHVAGLSVVVDGLENETEYFWRVRSENDNGVSGDSAVGTAITLITTIPSSNYAVNLPNNGDFINVCKVDVISPLITEGLTAEAWVRPDRSQALNGYLGVVEETADEKKGWLLGSKTDKFNFGVSGSTTTDAGTAGILTWISAEDTYTVGEWYHVAGTYDGTTMNLYVNGELAATSDVATGPILYPDLPVPPAEGEPVNNNKSNFVIGAYLHSSAFYNFRGMIAEARMWNRALTQQEIQDRMNYRADDYAALPDLKGYWSLDKGTGTTVTDLINGNNGTFQGTAAWADAGALCLFHAMEEVQQVSSGMSHNLALKEDGTVWAWGSNQMGQLGDGTAIQRVSPVIVEDADGNYLQDVVQVSAGFFHNLALKEDGTVWVWGGNFYSQLGIDGIVSSPCAVQVPGLTGITAVETRGYFNLVLKNDGTVWAWGRNDRGQLGDGTTTDSFTPVQVQAVTGSGYLENITAIAAGHHHGAALTQDEKVMLWGSNEFYQMGDGTTTDRDIADLLRDQYDEVITGIIAVDAGLSHTLALEKNNGNVWAWGSNSFGQLGDDAAPGSTPSFVKDAGDLPINGIQGIAAGYYHGMAWKADHSALIWGRNDRGQLGDGTQTDNPVPQTVVGEDQNPAAVSSISGGRSHTTALITDKTQFSWGLNTSGQLGDGTLEIRDIIQTDLGIHCSFAVKKDGTAWSWGYNFDYILGLNDTTNRSTPTQVKGINGTGTLANVNAISASNGYYHALALLNDGQVCAWGSNPYGQCGNGGTTTNTVPQYVKSEANNNTLTDVIAISAGYLHSVALKADHTVRTWGYNDYGQLGLGNYGAGTYRYYPQTPSITDVAAVSAGNPTTFALKKDGTVWGWGANSSGEIGQGNSTTYIVTPAQVKGQDGVGFLENITAVSAGSNHCLALAEDGTVWTWGVNGYGQLGDNSTTNKNAPVQVHGPNNEGILENIIAVATGGNSSMALRVDGTVFTWGYNAYGQLGNNTTTNSYTPVPVVYTNSQGILGRIVAMSGGVSHSISLDEDGGLWVWGINTYGQFGNGTTTLSYVPIRVPAF